MEFSYLQAELDGYYRIPIGRQTMDWQPWKHVSFTGGLRAVALDFSDGDGSDFFAYDIAMWGPVVGVSIKW